MKMFLSPGKRCRGGNSGMGSTIDGDDDDDDDSEMDFTRGGGGGGDELEIGFAD